MLTACCLSSLVLSAHSFIYDFAGVRGQGFFAVYDGHAGKKAAEWCGLHFHEVSFRSSLRIQRDKLEH